jgi:hypothetical protein
MRPQELFMLLLVLKLKLGFFGFKLLKNLNLLLLELHELLLCLL